MTDPALVLLIKKRTVVDVDSTSIMNVLQLTTETVRNPCDRSTGV